MSKVAIQGAATGTGVFTLASPATNTNRTLTLPDEAGTIDTLQRAGNVLQVVSATSSSEVTTTSTSYVATPLSASITPTSTSSKILIQYTARHWVNALDQFVFSTIFRNGVDLVVAGASNLGLVQIYSANARPFVGTGASFLDSPASTSNTTYTIYFKTSSGGTAGFGNNSQIATIILMEIAG